MIHVTVGTRHLFDMLGPRGHAFDAALRRVVSDLAGRPFRASFNSVDDLKDVTVFEVLAEFHDGLAMRLAEPPVDVIEAIRGEIMTVARDEYHLANFVCDRDDASLSLATHGVFPHGRIELDGPAVYLPDFSVSSRCYGFFGRPPSNIRETLGYAQIESFLQYVRSTSETPHPNDEILPRLRAARLHIKPPFAPYELCETMDNVIDRLNDAEPNVFGGLPSGWVLLLERTLRSIDDYARSRLDSSVEHISATRHFFDLSRVECHLCETLWDVFQRAETYLSELTSETDRAFLTPLRGFQASDVKEWLVLDAVAWGFTGHRSLRRDNPEVPPVANHRLLSASAIRLGIAKPVISELFAMPVWQPLPKPVKHFLLDAAEHAVWLRCSPLFPNLPTEDEMRDLAFAAQRAMGDIAFDSDEHTEALEKLGIHHAARRRIQQYHVRLDRGQWAWDWTKAIVECRASLFEDDIEQSLSLQSSLDLYPLHKRVLGLLEAIIGKRLRSQGRGIAERWRRAFSDSNHQHRDGKCSVAQEDDPLATVEVEGGWLVHASRLGVAGRYCRLADLLDDILPQVEKAVGINRTSISFVPATPTAHAKSLALIAAPQDPSRRLLLYLGNIILVLRNFIEHGVDQPESRGLLIENADSWRVNRGGSDVLQWNIRESQKKNRVTWRRRSELPGANPPAADTLLLQTDSLQRCLTLIALVLHGARSQLNLTY